MPGALVGFARRAAAGFCIAAASVAAACSEDSPGLPAAGGFDFWVLSLSWSPSYCAIEGEDANRRQCASGRDLGFVVHGLWPQFEAGWPQFCDSGEPDRVPDALLRDYLDLMPSAGLIGHQWRKHGSCSGLGQRDYLETVRAASQRVKLPTDFASGGGRWVDPDAVEASFLRANEGMKAQGVAVTCQDGYIEEVRICMNHALGFRACPQVDAKACKVSAKMPSPAG